MTKPSLRRIEERGLALSRRNFLRGLGVSIALPTLPSLITRPAGAEGTKAVAGAATTATGAPRRMAFMSIPNGGQQDNWFPSDDFTLNESMSPLEGLKQHFQVIGGIDMSTPTPCPRRAGATAPASAN